MKSARWLRVLRFSFCRNPSRWPAYELVSRVWWVGESSLDFSFWLWAREGNCRWSMPFWHMGGEGRRKSQEFMSEHGTWFIWGMSWRVRLSIFFLFEGVWKVKVNNSGLYYCPWKSFWVFRYLWTNFYFLSVLSSIRNFWKDFASFVHFFMESKRCAFHKLHDQKEVP